MYVLGIESATSVAAAAVVSIDGILAERMVMNKRTHSVNLLPLIKAVLEDAEINHSHLSGIAVSGGPGSFTGLRIGMSTAKALAQIWDLPVAGISTLETLAYPLAGHGRLVCPILNARKKEVYTAVFYRTGRVLNQLVSPMATSIEVLINILKDYSQPVTFLGDGVPEYILRLKESLANLAWFAPNSAGYPRGAVVAELGLKTFRDGRGISPLQLKPEYVRPSEAEVVWLKKNSTRR
ncbi:MAG: tRNA (adenosine(37)-N6)-threonylcarbamoyltransferase complex dimerization subunit type 1 TsaB [Desulfotomaculaceae bacterium]|nr:tRNA (adenosine(37)-N6)-threonylcarbamoyltransferase complex dimerization subunit type 1 TsaB [Desulfotomaculaceae bacterium]